MSLRWFGCPECYNELSTYAKVCPHCGCDLVEMKQEEAEALRQRNPTTGKNVIVGQAKRPFSLSHFIFYVAAIPLLLTSGKGHWLTIFFALLFFAAAVFEGKKLFKKP
jgi:hypothetical protein